MKNVIKYVATLVTVLSLSSLAFADDLTHHARVRLHGSTAKDGLGVSGVLEVPDLPTAPGQALGLLGLGVNGLDYNIGLHLGNLVLNGDAVMVADVRGSWDLSSKLFGRGNVRLNDLTNLDDTGSLYVFAMVDYDLPFTDALALGVETENIAPFNSTNREDYSVGPNLLVAVSERTRFELAYQLHSNDNVANQMWLRLDVKL